MSNRSIDLFFRGCQAERPVRLIAAPVGPDGVAGEVHRFPLEAPFAVLGRDARADVVLDDLKIDGRHCYIQLLGSRALLIRLASAGSTGQTRGRPAARWIAPGKGVRVGGHVITLDGALPRGGLPVGPDGDGSNSPHVPLITGPVPRAVLEFQANGRANRWLMKRAIVLVGSARECALKIEGTGISRYHAALVRTATGLWVVDLLGKIEVATHPGVLVNGELIRAARLDAGDQIRIGPYQITALYPEPLVRGPAVAVPLGESLAGLKNQARPASQKADRRPPAGNASSDPSGPLPSVGEVMKRQAEEIASLRREVRRLRRLAKRLKARVDQSVEPPERVKSSSNQEGGFRPLLRLAIGTTIRRLGSAVRRPITSAQGDGKTATDADPVSTGVPPSSRLNPSPPLADAEPGGLANVTTVVDSRTLSAS
jgi:pSer/pThr/pTyr-binding forkhead associated (FHA) protein